MHRVKEALEELPEVRRVSFESGSDRFTLWGGSTLSEDEVRAAVLSQVAFPRLRRWLGNLGRRHGADGSG